MSNFQRFLNLSEAEQLKLKQNYILSSPENDLLIDNFGRPFVQAEHGKLMQSLKPAKLFDGGFHRN